MLCVRVCIVKALMIAAAAAAAAAARNSICTVSQAWLVQTKTKTGLGGLVFL